MASRGDRLAQEQIDTYLALMEVAGQLRFRLEQHVRSESALTQVQFEILGRLLQEPGKRLRMTDLADRLGLSRSGLTYQVTALARAGFVDRASSPHDERSTIVELTAAGEREFLRVLPGHVDIVRSVLFEALPPEEMRTFGGLLMGIRDAVRALPPRSARRR